jgi:predicted ferric reductase
VLICGPAAMADALVADLPKHRVRPGNIVWEDFSFVT